MIHNGESKVYENKNIRVWSFASIIFLQIFILKDETNWLSVGGASLIFVSAAGVACRRLLDEIQSGKQQIKKLYEQKLNSFTIR